MDFPLFVCNWLKMEKCYTIILMHYETKEGLSMDIYFQPEYGKLYETIEQGKSEVYEYKGPLGAIQHMYIRREIPIQIDHKTYYDLITPYGYGGPLIVSCEDGSRDQLVQSFQKEFQSYCLDHNIVSEFIRFHPIVKNADDFQNCYEIQTIRKTVGTNLVDYDDPVQAEFSKSCRKNIRRAVEEGVTYRITENPSHAGDFTKIYYATMDRNDANSFYFFDDEYFTQCINLFPDHVILVEAIYQGKTIAMSFCFIYGKWIHIHLSGALTEYLHLSPSYILKYAVTMWGKEKGYELIHYGGGRTNSPEDNLYLFKKKFGRNTEFTFCTGKRIWNTEVYQRLCTAAGVTQTNDFFPVYRI